MENKIEEIREHIYEIKLDLREHIRRTAQNEEMIRLLKAEIAAEHQLNDPVRRAFIGAKWSMSAVIFVCTVIAIFLKMR
jgi:hypothetical protein